MSEALRAALIERAAALSQSVLDRMYENPFWMERYGERGRRFANEDSLHHVSYLVAALASGDAAVFERYAQWLRSVLVSRGMCSEHLGENFRLLASAIADAGLPDAPAAVDILARGQRSLRYPNGDAARLEAHRDALLSVVERAEVDGRPLREDDRRYLVSYLIDAVAGTDPAFLAGFAARAGAPVTAALTAAVSELGVRWPSTPAPGASRGG